MYQENFKPLFFCRTLKLETFLGCKGKQQGSILIWSLFLSLITSMAAVSILKQSNHQLNLISHFKQRNEQDIHYERLSQDVRRLLESLQTDGRIPNQYQHCFWQRNRELKRCSEQEVVSIFSSPESYSDVWMIHFERLEKDHRYAPYLGRSIAGVYDSASAHKLLIKTNITMRHSSGKVFRWSQGYEVTDARADL